jgi:hypothetical protein
VCTCFQFLVSRDTARCKCNSPGIEVKSDKAETYSDRFDMVIKIEECQFVSRCHQRVEGTLNEHELYLQKAFLVVTRRSLNSECRYY